MSFDVANFNLIGNSLGVKVKMNHQGGFNDPNPNKVTENIISQSLDFKDWLGQIQPEETRPRQKATLDKRAYSQNRTLTTWMTALLRWFRRSLGLIRKRQFTEFLSVEQLAYQMPDLFWGGHCDSPQQHTTVRGSTLPVWGWVIGRSCKVVAVRFVVNHVILEEIPVNASRPDVNKAYPFLPPENFGYLHQLSVKAFPSQGNLRLEAILENGQIEPIALVKFYRY